jgi:ADP-ribosylglycohydrolase
MQHKDLSQDNLLQVELSNLMDEGLKDSALLNEIQQAIGRKLSSQGTEELWQKIDAANMSLLNDPQEPSGLNEIQQLRPRELIRALPKPDPKALEDKIYGAWLGRCSGCTLGKPVEGWSREKIKKYLQAAGAYPLKSYIPAMDHVDPELNFGLWSNSSRTTLGNIRGMVRDDDIDYTVLGLKTLETYGRDFKPEDIGRIWLENLPFYGIFTAEAVAYRNFIIGIDPPKSACFRNPFREFIGAQIRADMWGYVNPGDPHKAAEFAFRDASVSHTKNGIYGEMWAAACIAAAFVLDEPKDIILAGLAEIPEKSRLAGAIRKIMDWSTQTSSWEEIRDKIEEKYGGLSSIHAINNTCLIVMGLMTGMGSLEDTLCNTLMGGWDTDCTCATAGSMIGAIRGVHGLPEEWIKPLNDQLESLVSGFAVSCISDLAKRTCKFIPGI